MILGQDNLEMDSFYIGNLNIFNQVDNEIVKGSLLRLDTISNGVAKRKVKEFLSTFNNFKLLSKKETLINGNFISMLDYNMCNVAKSKIIDGRYNVGGSMICHCDVSVNQSGCVSFLKLMIEGVGNDRALPTRMNKEELIIDNEKDHIKIVTNGISASSSLDPIEEDIDESER